MRHVRAGPGVHLARSGREVIMRAHNLNATHPVHHHVAPFDLSYRIVVRTVLWAIAGLVFLGLAIWWALT